MIIALLKVPNTLTKKTALINQCAFPLVAFISNAPPTSPHTTFAHSKPLPNTIPLAGVPHQFYDWRCSISRKPWGFTFG
jgi:hypothetical protein